MKTIIQSIDYEARGVTRIDGRTIFVNNALPQEVVQIHITQDKKTYAQADVNQILLPSQIHGSLQHLKKFS